ncbi:hypothetical protein [Lactococcus garvieae]|uniref:hypothetical protein n=1 Tax=Lactococcus garvieae TaxID=1363 RepID=UPI00398EE2AF
MKSYIDTVVRTLNDKVRVYFTDGTEYIVSEIPYWNTDDNTIVVSNGVTELCINLSEVTRVLRIPMSKEQ